jgi:hypothetical protein
MRIFEKSLILYKSTFCTLPPPPPQKKKKESGRPAGVQRDNTFRAFFLVLYFLRWPAGKSPYLLWGQGGAKKGSSVNASEKAI